MSSYIVVRVQERWVETIVHDVESPEQALEATSIYTDWKLNRMPVFTGHNEVMEIHNEEVK